MEVFGRKITDKNDKTPTLAKRYFPNDQNVTDPAVWPTVLIGKRRKIPVFADFTRFLGVHKMGPRIDLLTLIQASQKSSKRGQKTGPKMTLFYHFFDEFREKPTFRPFSGFTPLLDEIGIQASHYLTVLNR